MSTALAKTNGAAVVNPYAVSGRLTKAFKIAQALFRAGIAAEAAKLMSQGEWIEVAAHAGCKPPSEETQRIVLENLASFDEARQ